MAEFKILGALHLHIEGIAMTLQTPYADHEYAQAQRLSRRQRFLPMLDPALPWRDWKRRSNLNIPESATAASGVPFL